MYNARGNFLTCTKKIKSNHPTFTINPSQNETAAAANYPTIPQAKHYSARSAELDPFCRYHFPNQQSKIASQGHCY
jgi:hypothetical protein